MRKIKAVSWEGPHALPICRTQGSRNTTGKCAVTDTLRLQGVRAGALSAGWSQRASGKRQKQCYRNSVKAQRARRMAVGMPDGNRRLRRTNNVLADTEVATKPTLPVLLAEGRL